MTDPARLAADARELAIGMVDEVGQNDQNRAGIGPRETAAREAQRACDADQQTQRGQMIGRDTRINKRCHEPAG